MNADKYAQGSEWLPEVKQLGQLVEKIADCLLLLKAKRATLEEKMIGQYLCQISEQLGLLLARIFSLFELGTDKLNSELLVALTESNFQLAELIDDFLKIARYDLNFLEQYFEHDFCKRLIDDHNFLEDLSTIVSQLEL